MMDSESEAKLQLVCPVLAFKVQSLAEMMELAGEPIQVVQGFRSWAEQAKLYRQGRGDPGEIVTNAPPGHSWHEFGCATDCCPVSLLNTPNWSPDSPIWEDYGSKAESLGLFWGGRFVHAPKDRPHVQLTGVFPTSPNDEVRQILLAQGMEAVWQQAGLVSV
jgi:peptidoglycan L-alanyl-D-glutamate endopeptidase CwlK